MAKVQGGNIYIDMGDLATKIANMRTIMNKSEFEQMMYRTFGEVGKKSKTMVAKEVQKEYAVAQRWVKGQIGRYKLTMGASQVTCVIPVSGHKGMIGPTFKANTLKRGKISAKIVVKGRSRLPAKMKNQGGNPPFMVNGMTFTRRKNQRLPIVRVVGLGAAQFPLNRSEGDIQDALLEYTAKRLSHNFNRIFSGI